MAKEKLGWPWAQFGADTSMPMLVRVREAGTCLRMRVPVNKGTTRHPDSHDAQRAQLVLLTQFFNKNPTHDPNHAS